MGRHMTSEQMRIAAIVAFVVILGSGIWLSRLGRPLNGLLLNVHKLVGLGAAVYLMLNLYQTHQSVGLTGATLITGVITGLLFLTTGIIGGVLSTDRPVQTILKRLHQVTPVLTTLSTAVTLYLLGRGAS